MSIEAVAYERALDKLATTQNRLTAAERVIEAARLMMDDTEDGRPWGHHVSAFEEALAAYDALGEKE